MSFIFGGDTGMSYEDVQRKRKIAESLLAANTRGSRNVGEGLGAIGRALAAKAIEKRTGAAMERLNKEAEDLYSGVFGGGISSGGGASAPRVSTSSLDRSNDPTFIADDAMRAIGREPIHTEWEQIREGIFAGESGGDYDALFGYSQRPGGQFEGVKPTDMTVAEVSQFTDPSGDYGQWVKGQVGRVATPVGAYQIVGTTLRGAIDAGVVSPDEKFTREVQDRVGKWVLSTQGTGAWEGYKGPQAAGVAQPGGGGQPNVQAIVAALGNPIIRQDPGKVAVLNALLGRAMAVNEPVRGVTMGDRLVNPMTGQVIADFSGQGPEAEFQVQSSEILPNGTTVAVGRDGRLLVRSADGQVMQGQNAVDAVREGQMMAAEIARGRAEATVEGRNTAEAATGAAAAAAGEAGKQAVGLSGEAWASVGRIANANSNITTAIDALDRGARSGALDRYLPNISEASASLQNAMDRLGLDVIAGTTFGALSEAELRLAMETAVPRNLNEPDLRKWLERKKVANEKAMAMLTDAAVFLGTPGKTLKDWIEKNRSEGNEPTTTGAGTSATATHRYNPETEQIEAIQ